MPYSLQLKVKIEILMAELGLCTLIRRNFHLENIAEVPTVLAIKRICHTSLETGP